MQKYTDKKEFLHGGDYNPDQWLDYPEVLQTDLEYMQKAHVNTVTVGMFSWSQLEPEEGVYTFEWLDKIFDDIHDIGGNVILATPSGARPAWMSKKYPEVLRTNSRREKMLHGGRHNHCFTSPIYREKTAQMNKLLAERYGNHPSLLMWHISNEYGGECHCENCQGAFRNWVKEKYHTLEAVNQAWWGPFWSHRLSDWEEIESPSEIGENMVHGLNLDWNRFVTDQTIDFYKWEIKDIRCITPDIPITTNFMADTADLIPFQDLNYDQFAKHVDIVSWDCYPAWHNDWETTAELASKVGFINDLYRTLKNKPFLIMETTPSGVNWHDVNKFKRPGMHLLSMSQLLAHGSDSILYFQWRQSRGSSEKFHGAVVGHDNSTENRVFQDVKQVGEMLEKTAEIKGSNKKARVAIYYDWENNWALDDAQAYAGATKQYPQTLQTHYTNFWKQDIATDIVTPSSDLTDYDLLIVPMLYLSSEETMQKLEEYVEKGGCLVGTYLTGMVEEHDLAYLGGWPESLQRIFGIEVKETDTYYPKDRNAMEIEGKVYPVKDYATIMEAKEAEVLAVYQQDFYAGTPAVTRHTLGKGQAFLIGCRTEADFLADFYGRLITELELNNPFVVKGNPEVSVQAREDAEAIYQFIMNFSESKKTITIASEGNNLLTGDRVAGRLELEPYETMIVKVAK